MDIIKNLAYIDRFVIIDEYNKAELLEKIAYFKMCIRDRYRSEWTI